VRITHKIAMEFMLLGEDLDAKRAREAGMVNRVVPTGEELAEAQLMAKILANSAPLVMTTLKQFTQQTLNKSPAEAGIIRRELLLKVRESEDGAEEGRAFREKRTPGSRGT